ncbi:MAG: hypothetical protein AAF423_09250 [Pseudomonadota bacterium]
MSIFATNSFSHNTNTNTPIPVKRTTASQDTKYVIAEDLQKAISELLIEIRENQESQFSSQDVKSLSSDISKISLSLLKITEANKNDYILKIFNIILPVVLFVAGAFFADRRARSDHLENIKLLQKQIDNSNAENLNLRNEMKNINKSRISADDKRKLGELFFIQSRNQELDERSERYESSAKNAAEFSTIIILNSLGLKLNQPSNILGSINYDHSENREQTIGKIRNLKLGKVSDTLLTSLQRQFELLDQEVGRSLSMAVFTYQSIHDFIGYLQEIITEDEGTLPSGEEFELLINHLSAELLRCKELLDNTKDQLQNAIG